MVSDYDRVEELRKDLLQIQSRDYLDVRLLRLICRESHPHDLAEVLGDLEPWLREKIFDLVDEETRAEILDDVDEAILEDFVAGADAEELGDILEAMPTDEGADFPDSVPEEIREQVLKEVEDPEQARQLRELVEYAEDTAGAMMTKNYIAVPDTARAADAVHMIQDSEDAENRLYPYVINADGVLVGLIEGDRLLTSRPDTPVVKLLDDEELIHVYVEDDQEEVVKVARNYDLDTIPVVGPGNVLKGIVTWDDILDAADEEASEDMFRMAGTAAMNPTRLPVFRRVFLRLPWLLVTLLGGVITILVMKRFVSGKSLAVVYFVPIIQALGGAVGVQSSTIMVRGLSTGEVTFGRFGRIFFGELRVGLVIGLICGAIMGVVALLVDRSPDSMKMGLAVFAALSFGVLMSTFTGTAVPLVCKKLKLDPAIMSGTFVTMLNDVVALTIYLLISTALLALATT